MRRKARIASMPALRAPRENFQRLWGHVSRRNVKSVLLAIHKMYAAQPFAFRATRVCFKNRRGAAFAFRASLALRRATSTRPSHVGRAYQDLRSIKQDKLVASNVLPESFKKTPAVQAAKTARPDNTQRKSKRCSALSANVVALNPNEVRSGALTVHPESSGNLLAVPVARYA
jgi:hypothetical protein